MRVQGKSNLEALSCLFEIKKVVAYDIFPEVAVKFAREMSEVIKTDIEVVDSPQKAVIDLDFVVTSGPILKNPSPFIESDWLARGAFGSAVDFDSYWQGSALSQAEKIVTDDLDQMEYYRKTGYFKETPKAYADLGEIVSGKKPGRENENERIICINLGIALDDMATAILIYNKAKETGIGTKLPL